MSDRSLRLRKLSRRIKEVIDSEYEPDRNEPNRFPRDPNKPTDENVSVPDELHPGLTSGTLGGPGKTRHRSHQYEGPRGVASVEDGDDED